MNGLWVAGTHGRSERKCWDRIGFSKRHCIPPGFHRGRLHFEGKYVINEQIGMSGNDRGEELRMLLFLKWGQQRAGIFKLLLALCSMNIKGENLVFWDCYENRNSHKEKGTYWDFLSCSICASAQGALGVYFPALDLGSCSPVSFREREVLRPLHVQTEHLSPSLILTPSPLPVAGTFSFSGSWLKWLCHK